MPRFRTQYEPREPVYQPSGDPIKVLYSPRYDDRGVLDLVETGQEDLYAYIQSHKESTDIHVLLDRYANGETDVLQRMQGFYGDITSMPKTYAEVLNAVIAGEEAFSRLPVDVKQRFDNSFAVWLAAMDKDDFAERMGYKSDMTPSQVQDFSGSAGSALAAPSVSPPGAPAPGSNLPPVAASS